MHETFPHARKTDAAPLAARILQLTDTTDTTDTTCAGISLLRSGTRAAFSPWLHARLTPTQPN
jgi:hypothetical protein